MFKDQGRAPRAHWYLCGGIVYAFRIISGSVQDHFRMNSRYALTVWNWYPRLGYVLLGSQKVILCYPISRRVLKGTKTEATCKGMVSNGNVFKGYP